jgi:hypothetical protein
MKVITNYGKKKCGLKRNGLGPKCPIGIYCYHKMFCKHVKGNLCING